MKVPVISIVDDDESFRKAATSFIRSLGYRAAAFASAEEFLENGPIKETDCLITDVQMPGMTGFELQKQLLAQGHRLPIIFISAFPEVEGRKRAIAEGAIGFLDKAAGDEKAIQRLTAREERDLKDLGAIRDRMYGTYGAPKDPGHFFVRAARFIRAENYMRLLGGQLISSFTDAARTFMIYGLPKMAASGIKLATSIKALGLARSEARRLGIGLDVVMNSRGVLLNDTWVFDGTTWPTMNGGPSGRAGHALAYDLQRGRISFRHKSATPPIIGSGQRRPQYRR